MSLGRKKRGVQAAKCCKASLGPRGEGGNGPRDPRHFAEIQGLLAREAAAE
jgi:hypothetical protein